MDQIPAPRPEKTADTDEGGLALQALRPQRETRKETDTREWREGREQESDAQLERKRQRRGHIDEWRSAIKRYEQMHMRRKCLKNMCHELYNHIREYGT